MLKSLAGSARRKAIEELVFAQRWPQDAQPLLKARPDLQRIVEAVRWAPSAMNRQPWRLILTDTAAILTSVSKRSGLDNGIAMAHWTIAAHEEGLTGKWDIAPNRDNWRKSLNLPDNVVLVGVYPL